METKIKDLLDYTNEFYKGQLKYKITPRRFKKYIETFSNDYCLTESESVRYMEKLVEEGAGCERYANYDYIMEMIEYFKK